MTTLGRALRHFRPDLPRSLVLGGILLAALLLGLLKPWPLALIVDSVLGEKPFPASLLPLLDQTPKEHQILLLSGALLLLYTLHSGLSSLANFIAIGIGLRGLNRVRNEIFNALQRLSLRFHHGSRVGDLIHRAATDTYAFQTLFQHGIITGLGSTLSLCFILLIMAQLNPPLTLLALGVVPLLLLTIRFFGGRMRRLGLKAQQAESSVTSFIHQSILALPLIQSYTREEDQHRRFATQTADAADRKLSQHGSEILYGLMIALALALGTAGITGLGAHQVMSGQLTVGELLVFLAYLAQMFDPLNQLSHVGSTLASALAGVERVHEVLDQPEEVRDRPDARSLPSTDGALSLRNVEFAYQPGQPVLRGVSMELAAGHSGALIGPSGAGKTTLINLISRFFDPSAGEVLLDGIDLRDLKLKELRSRIGLVLQEPILLPATVAENIAFGCPGATPQQIQSAARDANAHSFIERLPRQYNTIVGDGAVHLSVGEKQRINIARAFLKNAPILLMDEPTSALDAESESLIVESLARLMKDRTTLIVAHRLTTIANVDTLLVLEDGRITQSGSPAELSRSPGYYRDILHHGEGSGAARPPGRTPGRDAGVTDASTPAH